MTLFLSGFAYGTPKYTDKETARALAETLYKGIFGRYTILSADVQNDNIQDYYISANLSDGSSRKWYIDEIYKWSRDDMIRLANNRALLFLDPEDSRFVVLDKNEFYRLALKANIYVKDFPKGDPLENNQLRFRVKSFNLINPTEMAFGRDRTGSKYRYLIDLFNGMRELLSYENAYMILKNKNLLFEKTPTGPTFERAGHVTKILAHKKDAPKNGVPQFGIEIQFDQAIQMTGDHFPYEIYERNQYNRQTKKSKKEFVLDITIPNSEKKFELTPIKNLEYLYNIKVVDDPKHHKRLLLRVTFNPTLLEIPPVVFKNSDNSIYVTFFNLTDQAILSPRILLETKEHEKAEQKTKKDIKTTKAIKKDSDFTRAMITAAKSFAEAGSIQDDKLKQEKLLLGIKQFEKAALYAKTDDQLFRALAKRNQMREIYIVIALGMVKTELAKETIDSSDIADLTDTLDQVEAFTGNEQVLENIEKLRERVIANLNPPKYQG